MEKESYRLMPVISTGELSSSKKTTRRKEKYVVTRAVTLKILHHHSSFKELLAIKMGIQKFEFHLIGHHFLVETDFFASRGMLNNKKATPQLLRLAAWFDQYSFEIRHIKGKDNVIPDYLSRPINSQPNQPQKTNLINPFIPLIYTMASSSSSPSAHTPSPAELRLITHNVPRSAPPDALSIITSKTPRQRPSTKPWTSN